MTTARKSAIWVGVLWMEALEHEESSSGVTPTKPHPRRALFDLPPQRTVNNLSGTYSYFVLKPQPYGNRGA